MMIVKITSKQLVDAQSVVTGTVEVAEEELCHLLGAEVSAIDWQDVLAVGDTCRVGECAYQGEIRLCAKINDRSTFRRA